MEKGRDARRSCEQRSFQPSSALVCELNKKENACRSPIRSVIERN